MSLVRWYSIVPFQWRKVLRLIFNSLGLFSLRARCIIYVYFKLDTVYCEHCDSADCRHLKFALAIPKVQETLRQKGWKLNREKWELRNPFRRLLLWWRYRHYFCKCLRCGYSWPRKMIAPIGWPDDSPPYGVHMHCPRCGAVIAQHVKSIPYKGINRPG